MCQVQYAVDLVALLVEKRRLAVDRDYREKQEMAALLGECCSAAVLRAAGLGCNPCYAGGLAGQVRLGRERGLARCGLQERGRSTSGQARSISRPRYQQLPAQTGTNPLADSHHRRQVDRLVKGYF